MVKVKLFSLNHLISFYFHFRHRWVHHITDEPPSTHPPVKRDWFLPYEENMSGTNKQYIPYSTTRTKIQAWQPNAKQQQLDS